MGGFKDDIPPGLYGVRSWESKGHKGSLESFGISDELDTGIVRLLLPRRTRIGLVLRWSHGRGMPPMRHSKKPGLGPLAMRYTARFYIGR